MLEQLALLLFKPTVLGIGVVLQSAVLQLAVLRSAEPAAGTAGRLAAARVHVLVLVHCPQLRQQSMELLPQGIIYPTLLRKIDRSVGHNYHTPTIRSPPRSCCHCTATTQTNLCIFVQLFSDAVSLQRETHALFWLELAAHLSSVSSSQSTRIIDDRQEYHRVFRTSIGRHNYTTQL